MRKPKITFELDPIHTQWGTLYVYRDGKWSGEISKSLRREEYAVIDYRRSGELLWADSNADCRYVGIYKTLEAAKRSALRAFSNAPKWREDPRRWKAA